MSTQRTSFAGAVVVITGAASGIGRATALRFAREGARLHLADVDGPGAEAVAEQARAAGAVAAAAHVVDVTEAGAVQAFADQVLAQEAAVDVLHLNAGIGYGGAAEDTTLDDWRRVLGVNLFGVVHGVQAFVPRLLAQGRPAHVVTTASVLGLVAGAELAPYVTSKFAVVGLSQALNAELSPRGVRFTAVCPGIINTAIIDAAILRGDIADRAAAAKRFYARRGSSPDKVADAVLDAVRRRKVIQPVPRREVVPAWVLARVSPRAAQVVARAMPRIMTSG
jgi:NAD(P)-dependent dehydrogenase (short-subunit alcohol dehydrogenase family)